ncbi:hypothetical protein [Vibrio breoganii]|uniref:hypothetical protein n=2 Tax=Vibrio breoganii TaxID=553239 RepID=UPI001054AF5D|nr:hypothetical protein [Vibrio breoganii]
MNSTLQIHVILENTEYLSSILECAKLSYVRTKILNQVQGDITEHYSKTTVVLERFYWGPNDSMPLEQHPIKSRHTGKYGVFIQYLGEYKTQLCAH